MKRLIFGIIGLFGLVVVAIVGIAMFVPPEDVKTEIVRQIRNNTGWNLRIDGGIDIGIWPNINLEAADVGMSGKAWADGLEFVSADRVSFGLALFPLVTGTVDVSTIRIENPVFELEIDRNGGTSWDPVEIVDSGKPPTSIEDAIGQVSGDQATSSESAQSTDGTDASVESSNAEDASKGNDVATSRLLQNLRISSFEVINGTLSYLDRRTGEAQTMEEINIQARLPSPDSRSSMEGSLVWRGQAITLDASIEKWRALLENTPSDIAAEIATDKGTVSVEGQVAAGGAASFNGKVAASIPSIPDMLTWATGSSDGVPEIGPVSVATPLLVDPTRISADSLALAIGEAKGSGSVALQLDGARPKLTSKFAVTRIDLDAIVKGEIEGAGDRPSEFGGARIIRASLDRPIVLAQVGVPLPNPRRSPPAASGTTAPAAQQPAAPRAAAAPTAADTLDLSALNSVDADLDISIGEILASGVSARDIALTAKLDAGRLVANLREADIFGGKTGGNLVLDSAQAVPSLTGAIKAASLNLASLAKLGGHKDPVAGALSIDTTFQTKGRSVAELVGALDAQGALQVRNGALDGLPLAAALNDPNATRIDNLSASVRFSGRTQPIVAEGSAGWRGETFQLKANLTPAPLALGRAAPVTASLNSNRVTLGYNGSVAPSGAADGAISVATPSLRNLLIWLNQPAPDMGGLGPFSFKGQLDATPEAISFNKATIRLDDTSGSGSGRIAIGGAIPSIQANLAFKTLNVTPYLAGAKGGAVVPSGQQGAAQSGSGQTAAAPSQSANQSNAAPRQAAAAGSSWSQAPIDFSGLKAANAKLTLSANEIIVEKIRVGPANVAVSLQDGVLTTDLTRLGLYQGSGKARFTLNGARQTPSFKAVANLSGISAYPLLRDAADFKKLEGAGDLNLDLAASGASEFAMVNSLNGSAAFLFRDGAIRGINIPKMVRGLSSNILSGWQDTPTEKTDFSSLSASFSIQNGVATNNDLSMIGPLVQVAGAGTTSLPPRMLAWRVEPKVVGTLLGQGRGNEFQGFGVPVVIEGSWDKPKIYPDIAGILQNPAAAYEQLRGLGGGIFKQIDPLNGGSAEAAQAKIKKRIEKQTGINVDNIVKDGKIDKDEAVNEAVKGIISIFGNRN